MGRCSLAETGLFVKLQIAAPTHPRLLGVSIEARWLWLCGLVYCKLQLSDGIISDAAFMTLPMHGSHESIAVLADQLIGAGLWDRLPNGFRVHDYLDHNPSRADVVALMEKRRAAGVIGGKASAASRKQMAEANRLASR